MRVGYRHRISTYLVGSPARPGVNWSRDFDLTEPAAYSAPTPAVRGWVHGTVSLPTPPGFTPGGVDAQRPAPPQISSEGPCVVRCPALYKGNLSSSIAFDPGLRSPQEKHQNLQLFKSLNLAMGTASGAFTALFGIDFPKAIFKGNVLGYQFRAANYFSCRRPIYTPATTR